MSTCPLRPVRMAPGPLGLYVSAGRLDQKDLQSFITSGIGGVHRLRLRCRALMRIFPHDLPTYRGTP